MNRLYSSCPSRPECFPGAFERSQPHGGYLLAVRDLPLLYNRDQPWRYFDSEGAHDLVEAIREEGKT